MSKTILANVDGFTPVIDGLVDEVGLMSAVVFGRVWRYCQMEDQVCKASLETIADSIGVDRVTVMRHIKELCERGYLEDLTPDLRNRPHVYVDTGKAGLTLSISGVAQSNTRKNGVTQRNVAESESNSTMTQRNVTVSESHLNKDLKKEVKDTNKDNLLEVIRLLAYSIFTDIQAWWNVRAILERDDIGITGDLGKKPNPSDPMKIIVSGLSEKPNGGQFSLASIWEHRFTKSFANLGVDITFEE